ncbi:CPBP family intramembrane glutamic endopeptidase [Lactobacillus ultunensis]|uniref:CAAX amino terminal protease family protein n=1 Tax=Lactobacillus ultunensis DSM 16047 TaxID=525365 RepID=C2EQ72_9LACO|nr:CPBP family intramembrane glutamic endopeptidase [Lactobacillus ultunensis]EEJ71293.1 CAAX amino terminal protease family protein [Lactobacillus ultunensis DSM 16047]
MKARSWDKILNIQLIINILIAGYLLVNVDKQLNIQLIFDIILLYITVARFLIKDRRVKKIDLALEIICLPVLLTYYLNWLVISLTHFLPALKLGIIIVYLILLLLYLLPTVVVDFSKIKNGCFRVITSIYLFLVLLSSINTSLSVNVDFIDNLLKTNVVSGLAFLILTPLLLKQWGFKSQMNVFPGKQKNFQVLVLILLVLFAAWLTFFNTYVYIATVPEQLFFNWNLSILAPTQWTVLRSAGAAIFEETERYLILVLLLYLARNSKFQVQIAIFFSALQFGLLHLTHFLDSDANASSIFYEVLYTFGYGCFLAVLYLYSGQIWLTMLSHFTLDLVSYSVGNGGAGFLSLYGDAEAIGAVLVLVVNMLVVVLMLLGKRKKVMQANAARLIERI